ncbi:MerR family transcriptional regulator [Amedibacillus sp. YH-ame10]
MLSIGEFSNICKVSTKTLRYYAEIGLILPGVIDPNNGYRYYTIDQLHTMLFINRLKSYSFSLDEIKNILKTEEAYDDYLQIELMRKKKEMEKHLLASTESLAQLNQDITNLKEGKNMMSYYEDIDVKLLDVPMMNILYIRKCVHQSDFEDEYKTCFYRLFQKISDELLTIIAPPMVLFHSAEFDVHGLDIEFAVPIRECVTGTRDFKPGLCLYTKLHGSYTQLPSIYAKHQEWAEKEGYINNGPLFEVYVNDPSSITDEHELVTEVYYPVKKLSKR